MRSTLRAINRHLRLKLAKAFGRESHQHHLRPKGRRERFETIYETGVWRHGREHVPGSGDGSTLEATQTFRDALPQAIKALEVSRLLDLGCGDFTWMQAVNLPCDYVGVDIVPSVIHANREKYPNTEFAVLDAVSDELPDADAVLCREVLFHLSLADARSALRNVLSKPRRFLIVTHDRDTAFNSDIDTGDFRIINLEKRPFRFPPPFMELPDPDQKPQRVMAVWRAEDIKRAL